MNVKCHNKQHNWNSTEQQRSCFNSKCQTCCGAIWGMWLSMLSFHGWPVSLSRPMSSWPVCGNFYAETFSNLMHTISIIHYTSIFPSQFWHRTLLTHSHLAFNMQLELSPNGVLLTHPAQP